MLVLLALIAISCPRREARRSTDAHAILPVDSVSAGSAFGGQCAGSVDSLLAGFVLFAWCVTFRSRGQAPCTVGSTQRSWRLGPTGNVRIQ